MCSNSRAAALLVTVSVPPVLPGWSAAAADVEAAGLGLLVSLPLRVSPTTSRSSTARRNTRSMWNCSCEWLPSVPPHNSSPSVLVTAASEARRPGSTARPPSGEMPSRPAEDPTPTSLEFAADPNPDRPTCSTACLHGFQVTQLKELPGPVWLASFLVLRCLSMPREPLLGVLAWIDVLVCATAGTGEPVGIASGVESFPAFAMTLGDTSVG